MAVGLSIRNLFVLTLIGSFAYTVYPLPVRGTVEQRRPGISSNSSNNLTEIPSETPFTLPKNKHPFWQPRCKVNQQRHKRSLKQIKQVLKIMVRKLNQTFLQIHNLYKEPITKIRYTWLPKNPGKKIKQLSTEQSYGIFYTRLQEYAVILHLLNKTGPPAGYDPNQFNHAQRQSIINSIANLIKQMLCELEYTMKGKTEIKQVNVDDFRNVIPENLNQTQLHVYDMATFNAYKKFLTSWKKLLQKGKKNGKKNNGGKGDDENKKKNKKKDPAVAKKKKGHKVGKVSKGAKGNNMKVPGKHQKKQPM